RPSALCVGNIQTRHTSLAGAGRGRAFLPRLPRQIKGGGEAAGPVLFGLLLLIAPAPPGWLC
ncbi:unnamed protein product, partial [Amoebophrya sp. A120]